MNGELELIKDKVSRLESRLEELITEHRKAIRCLSDYDLLLRQHCTMNDADIQKMSTTNEAVFQKIFENFRDAFERIRNLEFKAYPGLAQDIIQIHNIIGDEKGKGSTSSDGR